MSTTVTAPATAAEQFALRRHSPVQRIQHTLHSHPELSPLVVLIISFVIFTIINPRMALPSNFGTILQQVAPIAALAIGQTLIILTAGIDLSVGTIAILSSLFMANFAFKNHLPGVLCLILGIAAGLLAGFINGFLVTRIKLPPFIVTLGTFGVFTAIALLYSGGVDISRRQIPSILSWTRTSISFGSFEITTGVILVAVMALVIAFILSQTTWGRHVYAVGNDVDASRLVGIRVDRVLLSVYAVAGLLYGITAWVQIGRSGNASANSLQNANLDSITAVVIGGTSLFGGRGSVLGTILGALIVQVFAVGLSLANVDAQWRLLATGLLVIIAVSIDQWIRRVKA